MGGPCAAKWEPNTVSVLDYAQFWRVVLSRLGRESSSCPDRTSTLRVDLAMDDLDMYGLIALFDEFGVDLPEALIPQLFTADDVFYYYTTIASALE
jgi:hypothetical protein